MPRREETTDGRRRLDNTAQQAKWKHAGAESGWCGPVGPHKNQTEEHSWSKTASRREDTDAPPQAATTGRGWGKPVRGHRGIRLRAHGPRKPGTLMRLKGLVLARKPRG